MNRLSVALAGRVAENLVFGDISSGAQNDLKEATSLAEKMVAQWGMSDKVGRSISAAGRASVPGKGAVPAKALQRGDGLDHGPGDTEDDHGSRDTGDRDTGRERQVLDALAEALLKEEMLERVDVELIIKNAQGESKRT